MDQESERDWLEGCIETSGSGDPLLDENIAADVHVPDIVGNDSDSLNLKSSLETKSVTELEEFDSALEQSEKMEKQENDDSDTINKLNHSDEDSEEAEDANSESSSEDEAETAKGNDQELNGKDAESEDEVGSECDDGEVEIGDSFIDEENEIQEGEKQMDDEEMNGVEMHEDHEWRNGVLHPSEHDPSSFLEPACELAESAECEQDFGARLNIRKRGFNSTDDFENDSGDDSKSSAGPSVKKLKFNFGKKNFRRQRPYTNEAVKEAIKMVQVKKMSILEASRQYDIPRTSLHNFIRMYKRGKKIGVNPITPGLTKQEESEMVSLVIKLSRCGKRYSHNELRYLIQYYLINNDRPVFKSGTLPTMGWIAGLVERQPELIKAKSKKNTKVDAEDVEEWQAQIEDYLVNDWELDVHEIFQPDNGHRIFCFNAFKMTVNGPAESAEYKPQVKKEPGSEEEKDQELSVILGMSADGTLEVPLIVFSEENRELLLESDPSVLKMAFNKTARIEEDVALQVVKDFDEEIISRGIPKPVIFLVNDKQDMGHFSVIEYCWENQIVIICLPPKTSKTLTPFEVGIWPRVRSSYAALWKNAPKNFDSKLSVEQFPELFIEAWNSSAMPNQAIRGFRKSGLIPFNVPAIFNESITVDQLDEKICLPTQTNKKHSRAPKETIKREISSTLEEKSRGKLEGIQMCLDAIESFIPEDILPVWNARGADHRGRCELAFKLWKSVSLLLKAGCAMASIQQMADGFFNPFVTDFSSTATFFQNTNPMNSLELRPPSPQASTSSVPLSREATPKKRKLNKSIYSVSDASPIKVNGNGEESAMSSRCEDVSPLVRFHQNPFLLHSVMDADF